MWYNSTFCRNGFPLCYIDILKAVANNCFNKIKVTTKKVRDWFKKNGEKCDHFPSWPR